MKIAVLGCGWLGLPLAERLIAEGHTVNGSTTTEAKMEMLQEKQITPFLLSLQEDTIEGDIEGLLHDIEVLIVNVPPGLRKSTATNFVAKIKVLISAIEKSGVQKVVFVSSTSVYGANQGEVTEDTIPEPNTESGRQLLAVENLLNNTTSFKTAIIRFAGLIGPDRHPIKFLSGKRDLKNGKELIHLIQFEDCIKLILKILRTDEFPFLLNAVYPSSLTKQEYYTKIAEVKNVECPYFTDNKWNSEVKVVRSKFSQYSVNVSILKC
ncbi:NAD-dependent epimerase/dehydratase family protein [Neptunitalea lumnitzerae]|uniref:Epimerase n=1 Tax=Neptunitalea lumnitzerae TaxID=2965509 RepID=A0ABQ5MGZ8_9FLAO|nr:NAD(P)H-binding protein [Neptunitalea sp. Y10]GLB48581.1 epimerase [Neptunitalea sp. Y10]